MTFEVGSQEGLLFGVGIEFEHPQDTGGQVGWEPDEKFPLPVFMCAEQSLCDERNLSCLAASQTPCAPTHRLRMFCPPPAPLSSAHTWSL